MESMQPLSVTVQIELEERDDELLDSLARQLMDELSEGPVDSVDLVRSGPAPAGTKSAEAVTLGALAVAVLPSLLPKLVEFSQAWALRGQGRSVKFKGKVGGQEVEFEGKAEDLQRILAMLSATPSASPSATPAAPTSATPSATPSVQPPAPPETSPA